MKQAYYLGFKKVALTTIFSLLSVFRFFFRNQTNFGSMANGNTSENTEWEELTENYSRLMNELEIEGCVISGKAEQECRATAPILA
jgi:hypothetical protein